MEFDEVNVPWARNPKAFYANWESFFHVSWANQFNCFRAGSFASSVTMNLLRYIEKCSGPKHNGPAWIAYVQTSKSKRTIYFNGLALQRATSGGEGNHFDVETGDFFWISGVKKRGSNRHWAGSGPILVEQTAAPDLLAIIDQDELDPSLYRIAVDCPRTDPQKFVTLLNEKL
jgi:hypothetical protein